MIILTYHAVEQFMSRCKTDLSQEAAWEYLEKQLPYARKMQQRSLCGDTLWSLPNGHYLITRSGRDGHVAVTFLRELCERPGPGPTEEELEMLIERAVTDSPSPPLAREGTLRFAVSLEYVLGADNEPIAVEKIEQALRTAVGALKGRYFAKATVPQITIARTMLVRLVRTEDKEAP